MATGWRAEYVGDCDQPAPHSAGTARLAPGFYDQGSAQFGAYLFTPDGLPGIDYYVAEGDLRFHSEVAA